MNNTSNYVKIHKILILWDDKTCELEKKENECIKETIEERETLIKKKTIYYY